MDHVYEKGIPAEKIDRTEDLFSENGKLARFIRIKTFSDENSGKIKADIGKDRLVIGGIKPVIAAIENREKRIVYHHELFQKKPAGEQRDGCKRKNGQRDLFQKG